MKAGSASGRRDGRRIPTAAMQRFLHAIGVRSGGVGPWTPSRVRSLLGGDMFLDGAYRCHTDAVAREVGERCRRAFPESAGRWESFGGDWTGRQFVVDGGRSDRVSIVDPGFAAVLETDVGIEAFHDEELVEYAAASVLADLLGQWRAADREVPAQGEAAGYRVPPFLGGEDTIANLETQDLVVYLDLFAQLRLQTRDLPDGTPVRSITTASDG